MSDTFAESCVEVIDYLLHEQSPEMHRDEVEEERWFIELGERPAFRLVRSEHHLGDFVDFTIMDVLPYFYRTKPHLFDGLDGPHGELGDALAACKEGGGDANG